MFGDLIQYINYLVYGLGWVMLLLIQYVILFKTYYSYADEHGHVDSDDLPGWLYPLAVLFVLEDAALNATVFSILMLELPREFMITARMKRYKEINDTDNWRRWWQYHTATNMCLILNISDKKGHC